MRGRWRESGVLLVVAVLLAWPGGQPAASERRGGPTAPMESVRRLFLEKCSRCHEPERAYRVITDRPLWTRTVASMAIMDRHWIPPEAVRRILDYSIYYRPHQRTVFRRYCGGCHDREELRYLRKNEAQWRICITYMAQRYGGEISKEEVELLVCGLDEGI